MSELDDFFAEVAEIEANPEAHYDKLEVENAQSVAVVGEEGIAALPANEERIIFHVEDDDAQPGDGHGLDQPIGDQSLTANPPVANKMRPSNFLAPRQVAKAAASKSVIAVAVKAQSSVSSSVAASYSLLPTPPIVSQHYAPPSVHASNPSWATAGSSGGHHASNSAGVADGHSLYGVAGAGAPSSATAAAAAPHAGDKRKFIRVSAGEAWDDPSLAEWPDNDFRLFCGDLGHDVSDEMLAEPFRKYKSFVKAKMIQDKLKPGKSKGYGFASFLDPYDGLAAMKEVHGKYIGLRPVRIKRSNWQDRNKAVYAAKEKEKAKRAAIGLE